MKKFYLPYVGLFVLCVILDNRESVYIAYSSLFLYNIDIYWEIR